MFVLNSDSSIWKSLKINVLESRLHDEKWEIYLEKQEAGIISMKSSKNINDIENIYLSIAYNPDSLKIL